MDYRSFRHSVRLAVPLVWALLAACSGGSATTGSLSPAPAQAQALPTAGLAGLPVAVVPITIVIAHPSLGRDEDLADRVRALNWADSLIGDAMERRAPDVKWVLPPQLRKIARRAPSIVVDPDHMGQSIMRERKLKEVPDPLRANLRSLVALAGGRFAFIPAALSVSRDSTNAVQAELAAVVADVRTGKVGWRTLAVGKGASPTEALGAALATIFPAPSAAP